MEKLTFHTSINAPASKVWQVLWTDETYRAWTTVFHEGSHAVSDWKEGSKINFLGPDGSGMYSVIDKLIPNEYMAFKHLGEMKNFEEQPNDEKSKSWSGSMETYTLKEENGVTALEVSVDVVEDFNMLEYFKAAFPKALALVKEISEKPFLITIDATVNAPVEKVWDYWNKPEHIKGWCFASDDWHCPKSENDLQVGGKINSRMEAKDGSFGFDFWSVYKDIQPNKSLSLEMGDGRIWEVKFEANGNETKVTEVFEAEQHNPVDMQRGGWQMILNNFKKYTETN
jgi:uncharacterized protein YndB with AHSA1/START domain